MYFILFIFIGFIIGYILCYILNKINLNNKKIGTISINVNDIDINNLNFTIYNPKRIFNKQKYVCLDIIYDTNKKS